MHMKRKNRFFQCVPYTPKFIGRPLDMTQFYIRVICNGKILTAQQEPYRVNVKLCSAAEVLVFFFSKQINIGNNHVRSIFVAHAEQIKDIKIRNRSKMFESPSETQYGFSTAHI